LVAWEGEVKVANNPDSCEPARGAIDDLELEAEALRSLEENDPAGWHRSDQDLESVTSFVSVALAADAELSGDFFHKIDDQIRR
jgi:hypothetical protein